MVKWAFVLLAFLFILFSTPSDVFSQCAMCKATLEAGGGQKGTIGAGLNTGILYLMSVPYIAGIVLAFFWFRNVRAKKRSEYFQKGVE